MADTTRYHNFLTQVTALLETQDDVRVAVTDDEGRMPYCWAELGELDDYDTIRDESGQPTLNAEGKSNYPGMCEFFVLARYKVDVDTGKTGTLRLEGARLTHILERALKYGTTLTDFSTAEFSLHIHEVAPRFNTWATGSAANTGMIQISGYIKYIQYDK